MDGRTETLKGRFALLKPSIWQSGLVISFLTDHDAIRWANHGQRIGCGYTCSQFSVRVLIFLSALPDLVTNDDMTLGREPAMSCSEMALNPLLSFSPVCIPFCDTSLWKPAPFCFPFPQLAPLLPGFALAWIQLPAMWRTLGV